MADEETGRKVAGGYRVVTAPDPGPESGKGKGKLSFTPPALGEPSEAQIDAVKRAGGKVSAKPATK